MPADEVTDEIYEQADLGNRVGFGDTPAVVVVDFQYGMTDPDNPLGSDMTAAVEQTDSLVAAAHEADVPVVFTRVITSQQDGHDMSIWTKKAPKLKELTPGSRWVEIDERLDVHDEDHILDKRQASAFHETELNSMLVALGVDTVIVTGSTTSGCVRASVIDACSLGYRTIVPGSCVADRSTRQAEANLYDMNAKYADVVPREEVIEYLETDATPPTGV